MRESVCTVSVAFGVRNSTWKRWKLTTSKEEKHVDVLLNMNDMIEDL